MRSTRIASDMPYDTRRKSLSLPSLGIQLPQSAGRVSRATAAVQKASSPAQTTSTRLHSPPTSAAPPSKRVKRSHASSDSLASLSPPPSRPSSVLIKMTNRARSMSSTTSKMVTFADRSASPDATARNTYNNTPPPSPRPGNTTSISPESINDDIVFEVVQQLEKTGNRPHLIRELATVLTNVSKSVSNSANPGALISSRLQSFFKRDSWTARKPCPIETGKTNVHPRKVYYFLRTMPCQELPADSSDLFDTPPPSMLAPPVPNTHRIITPSISSVDEDPEAAEERKRAALSPSPEVDLAAPEPGDRREDEDSDADVEHDHMDFATSPAPIHVTSFSARSSLGRDGSCGSGVSDADLSHNHRAVSPPLEHEEREFTQTASKVRMRGMSMGEPESRAVQLSVENCPAAYEDEETIQAKKNREVVETLFGKDHGRSLHVSGSGNSPFLRPTIIKSPVKIEDAAESPDFGPVGRIPKALDLSASIMSDTGLNSASIVADWDTRLPEEIAMDELEEMWLDF